MTGQSPSPLPTRTVVVFSAHHWASAVQVSAHHYARLFAQDGWKVLFLSTPVTPFHALAAPRSLDHRRRLAAWWRSGRAGSGSRVIAYTPMTVLPLSSAVVGLRFSPLLEKWWRYTVPRLVSNLHKLGFWQPDLAIVDSSLGAFIPDILGPAVSVYRMTDYNPGFASSTPELARLEASLARRVDIVVVTASELLPRAKELAPDSRVVHVPHGVDIGHFAGPSPEPPDLAGTPRPIAIYVGSLREWFAFDLVSWLASELPEISFVLVGPERAARGKLEKRHNLFLLGERPYSEIPGYLKAASAGLIPFDREGYQSLVDHSNPLKLYEYMAAGLPVVATDWPVLRRVASPALLASSREEFRDQLLVAIGHKQALGEAGERFAAEHSWDTSYRELRAAIDPLLPPRQEVPCP